MLYLVVLGSFSIVECVIGISLKNVHIVRDFLSSAFLLMTLGFSLKAMQISESSRRSEVFNYGHARFNLLAAFLNTSLIVFICVYGFIETIRHILEQAESENHENDNDNKNNEIKILDNTHDDKNHIAQINLYMSIYSLLRLAVFGLFLYMEKSHLEVQNYFQTNWLNWPRRA